MAVETKNQLALHQSRQEQLIASARYIEQFLAQPQTKASYERSKCPTCNNQTDSALFTKNNGEYCYCSDCRHIYLANPLGQRQLIEFYSGYPTSSLDWHVNESHFYERIYSKGLDLIKGVCQSGNLLDIGCSGGYFLSIAHKRGYKVHGIEPNEIESSHAKREGFKILGSTIDDLHESTAFEIVTLWDVLEHIPNPIDYLKQIKSHLSPGALIFVQIPTCDSLAARVMRGACNMFDGIEHLTLFSAHSLDLAFSKAGYALVDRQSVISESQVLQNFMSYASDPYLSQPCQQFQPEFLSADSIEAGGHGYKIQGLYRLES